MFHSLAFVALSALVSALAATPSTSTSPAPVAPAVSTAVAVQVSGYGSTGVDGALVVAPSTTRVINLASEGTFDAVNWVVRFDYTSVNIGANATVNFLNHPSRAPVAWIVQGDVVIGTNSTVNLNGTAGTNGTTTSGYAEPGPGGFRGGRSASLGTDNVSSAGFGPGGGKGNPTPGGNFGGAGASYRLLGQSGFPVDPGAIASAYGGPVIFQLIGGSGGGASRVLAGSPVGGGGGGGGALLIAADGIVDVYGTIRSNGGAGSCGGAGFFYGGGGGSGGAVRLASLTMVAIRSTGLIQVNEGSGGSCSGNQGGSGSTGRVRIESPGANRILLGSVPANTSLGEPQLAFRTSPPRLRVVSIGGQAVPAESSLEAGLGNGESADLALFEPGLVDVVVDSENLPVNSLVYLRITRARAHATVLGPVTLTSGTSVTFTGVDLSLGYSALQARAVLPQP